MEDTSRLTTSRVLCGFTLSKVVQHLGLSPANNVSLSSPCGFTEATFCHFKKIDDQSNEDIMGEGASVRQKELATNRSGTGRVGLCSSIQTKILRTPKIIHKITCSPSVTFDYIIIYLKEKSVR